MRKEGGGGREKREGRMKWGGREEEEGVLYA